MGPLQLSLLWQRLQSSCNRGVGEDALISEEVLHLLAVEDDGTTLLDQELVVRGLQAVPVGDDAPDHVLEPDGGQLEGPQARLPKAAVAPHLDVKTELLFSRMRKLSDHSPRVSYNRDAVEPAVARSAHSSAPSVGFSSQGRRRGTEVGKRPFWAPCFSAFSRTIVDVI